MRRGSTYRLRRDTARSRCGEGGRCATPASSTTELPRTDRLLLAPDRRRRPTYGPMPGVTEPLAVSGPPMVAYRFEDSRSGECAVRHLNGYTESCKWTAMLPIASWRPDRCNDGITLAGCWSHSSRKFYELLVAGSSRVATTRVERIAQLGRSRNRARPKPRPRRTRCRAPATLRGDRRRSL